MTNDAADHDAIVDALRSLAAAWRQDRTERQQRTSLEPVDFTAIAETGFLKAAAPVGSGGTWNDLASSVRPIAAMVRLMAAGDPSVALVSSMHPSVLAFWLTTSPDGSEVWQEQRRAAFATAVAGQRWGTITSEPGSGGDVMLTKAVASPGGPGTSLPGAPYLIDGVKHFGSGSGIVDWMVTTAVAEGEDSPALFVLDVKNRPWDGSAGLSLVAEWDGIGMKATQSHGMRLDGMPATRFAFDGPLLDVGLAANPLILTLFCATILGVVDEAVHEARERLSARAAEFGAYDQVQWARAVQLHWLAAQAVEGAISAIERNEAALQAAIRAKVSVAELAEETLGLLTRVVGGGAFSQRSPFSHWYEDVRALGFLRPPWALAYQNLFDTAW